MQIMTEFWRRVRQNWSDIYFFMFTRLGRFFLYRINLYIGPASVDWTSLTASKETCLEDVMLGVEVWLENMNESQYK